MAVFIVAATASAHGDRHSRSRTECSVEMILPGIFIPVCDTERSYRHHRPHHRRPHYRSHRREPYFPLPRERRVREPRFRDDWRDRPYHRRY